MDPRPCPTVPVDQVVATRRGEVLIKSTILKSDHFPGCQNKKLLPLLDGAPNFRQVPGLPVYGVAIPTVAGVKRVLDVLGAQQGKRPVKWFNMREEPVLYINGNPYVVREASKPFANLEITGIDRSRVEDMENRLRADVLREAEQYDGQVLLAHENDDFQVIEEWEPVTKANVQTPLDVYKCLNEEGYSLEYLRVPVTDEKAPKERDFVVLQRRIWDKPPDTALIFNCQMGRGRTTTGMIIGSLLLLRQHTSSLPSSSHEGLPLWFAKAESAAVPKPPATSGDELKDGKYGVVRSLLRVLEGGTTSKEIVDHVIDACSAMQNLREAISGYRSRLTHESHEDKRNALLHVCLEYLERYYVLISYAAYLFDPNFDPDNPEQPSFGQWIKNRPELRSVLQRMLRRNPLAALALHRPTRAPEGSSMLQDGASPRPGRPHRSSSLNRPEGASDDEDAEAEDETASLIAHRTGMVLGAHTILKEDHFPGCQSPKLPEVVQGAPNFRGAQGFNVYGSALPTVDGIRRTLQQVNCQPGSQQADSEQARALWYNMREEPVIYINGRPFVLREEERPFKNMQEYTGIDARRLEQMESRLKADVLREMTGFNGRVLVAHETSGQSGGSIMRGSIVDEFEDISGPESIQTPREVYEALRADGYKCDYYRVPLTDGTAPKEVAFDTFYQHVKHAAPHDPVIFNCQMGAGRTTTGMVIACLIRMYTIGDGRMPNVQDIMGADNQCAGMSPRSAASDDIAGGSPGNSDDEAGENLNDRNEPQPSSLSDSMHTCDGNPAEVECLRVAFYVVSDALWDPRSWR
ncbi:hypothetical protein WJX84_004658 [Apatococcus fuscideae]|uniref:Paladin n=1 Tax=Apatococcus fuscideae TaxID=2026836 RepID=A0AAW1SVS1_9CHLO